MYLVALLVPPLAILLTGRIFQAVFCCLVFPIYFPAALWAILVVADHKANKRTDRLIDEASRIMARERDDSRAMAKLIKLGIRHDAAVARDEAAARGAGRSLVVMLGVLFGLAVLCWELLKLGVKGAARVPAASVRAYHELPEWAQPVSWGLAAGTPFAIIAVVLFSTNR